MLGPASAAPVTVKAATKAAPSKRRFIPDLNPMSPIAFPYALPARPDKR
ncbi:hypothetical protein SBA_ch1_18030 [Sphingomonas bisphenolicum]|uniref:Uncharacterized protein n=1 Tax=Sphingomonas bisphenolicum TaxID=296544 RepID=A0ABM7G3N8_9SPHN|nr:hypothetical protein SBA_ch1_18030 [Sphingomonas bisphenolicum]